MSATTAPPPAVLEARGLCVSYPAPRSAGRGAAELKVVDGLDLAVKPGEVLGLVGESGCGKSTLARALVGLEQPAAGEVLLDGKPLDVRERAQRRSLQMVFQDPFTSLNPRMTVRAHLAELLRLHATVPRNAVDGRCRELMQQVGLPETMLDRYPRALSGGQRQRVSIARALATDPRIIVADEPVSALDVSVQATVLELFASLSRELGLTLVFISHNLAVVRHLCDRVAVMYLGGIVETADTDQLFERPRHPYTQALLSAVPRLRPGSGVTAPRTQGDPPGPLSRPSGCGYHPRCPIAADVCRTDVPVLSGPVTPEKAASAPHQVACHLA